MTKISPPVGPVNSFRDKRFSDGSSVNCQIVVDARYLVDIIEFCRKQEAEKYNKINMFSS